MRPYPLYRLNGIKMVVFDVYGTLLVSGAGEPTSALTRGFTAGGGTAPNGCLVAPARRENGRAKTDRAVFAQALADARFTTSDMLVDFVATWFRREIEAFHKTHSGGSGRPLDRAEVDIREIWRNVLRRVADAGIDAVGPGSEGSELLAARYECLANPVCPMPGAADAIRRLHTHGYELGIVSNAQFFTPIVLEHMIGDAYHLLPPDRCIYSFQIGRAKPDLRLFEDLLERAPHLSPPSLLYVGNDMLNDVASAQRAGLCTCLFAGDKRSLRLREHNPTVGSRRPDTTICSLDELFPVLGIERSARA